MIDPATGQELPDDYELQLAQHQQAAELAAQQAAQTHVDPLPAPPPPAPGTLRAAMAEGAIPGTAPALAVAPVPEPAPSPEPPPAPAPRAPPPPSPRQPKPKAPDELAQIDKQTAQGEDQHVEQARAATEIKAERAGQQEKLLEGADAAAEERAMKVGEAVDYGNKRLEEAQQNYGKKVQDYEDSKKLKSYWDTHSKLGAALMVAAGGFSSGAKAAANIYAGVAGGGRPFESTENVGIKMLEKGIDDDHRQQLERIESAKDSVLMAKYGVQDAREAKRLAVEDIDAKYDAVWKSVEVRAKRIAMHRGADEATAEGEAAVQLAKQKQLEIRRGNVVEHKKLILDEIRTRAAAAASYANADESRAGAELKRAQARGEVRGSGRANVAESTAITSGQNTIRGIDDLLTTIDKSPKAWSAYRSNAEAWQRKTAGSEGSSVYKQGRGLLQAFGGADVSPEQGLKGNKDALRVHQGMQEALTGIAKSYGGVITDGDRQAASAALATLAQDPEGARQTLLRIRKNAETGLNNLGRGAPAAPERAAPEGGGGRLSPADARALSEYVRKNPTAPDAEEARQLLRAAVR